MDEHEIEAAMVQVQAFAQTVGLDLDEITGQITGATLFGMTRHFVDAGVPAHKALTLAAFMIVDGTAGRGATLALGLSERQARRDRAAIREAMAGVDLPEEVPARYVEEWSKAMDDRKLWAAKGHVVED